MPASATARVIRPPPSRMDTTANARTTRAWTPRLWCRSLRRTATSLVPEAMETRSAVPRRMDMSPCSSTTRFSMLLRPQTTRLGGVTSAQDAAPAQDPLLLASSVRSLTHHPTHRFILHLTGLTRRLPTQPAGLQSQLPRAHRIRQARTRLHLLHTARVHIRLPRIAPTHIRLPRTAQSHIRLLHTARTIHLQLPHTAHIIRLQLRRTARTTRLRLHIASTLWAHSTARSGLLQMLTKTTGPQSESMRMGDDRGGIWKHTEGLSII